RAPTRHLPNEPCAFSWRRSGVVSGGVMDRPYGGAGRLVRFAMPGAPEGAGGSLIGEEAGEIPQGRKHEQERDRRPPTRIRKGDQGPRRVQPQGERNGCNKDAAHASKAVERDRDPREGEREGPALERHGRVRPELEGPGQSGADSAGGEHRKL